MVKFTFTVFGKKLEDKNKFDYLSSFLDVHMCVRLYRFRSIYIGIRAKTAQFQTVDLKNEGQEHGLFG